MTERTAPMQQQDRRSATTWPRERRGSSPASKVVKEDEVEPFHRLGMAESPGMTAARAAWQPEEGCLCRSPHGARLIG